MRILGIDPGYDRLGLAIIDQEKSSIILIHSECFIPKEKTLPGRLKEVGKRIEEVIKKWRPDNFAIETLFFSKNQKTALAVSAVRGVIIYEGAKAALPLFEYSPNEIKLTVGGWGRSDKKQVANMVQRLVKIDKKIIYDDEYDAIAVALTKAARKNL